MKNVKKVFLVVFVVLMALTWTACSNDKPEESTGGDNTPTESTDSAETSYPLTITDDAGYEITLDKAPEKIVSIAPSNTEVLFALGLGDKVIGRTEFCNYPEEATQVEVVGGYADPNTERIIELEPDVIFASFVSVPEDAREMFEASGIKIIIFNPTNVDGVLASIKQMGQITNVQEKSNELVEKMSAKREEIVGKVKDVNPKRVFIDVGDYYTATSNSFIGSMLEEINTINIADGGETDYPQLSLEKIIDENPEVYISTITPAEDIKKVAGIESIEAYKNDHIVEFAYGTPEHDIIQQPGPRVIDGLEIYAKAIYPEAFE